MQIPECMSVGTTVSDLIRFFKHLANVDTRCLKQFIYVFLIFLKDMLLFTKEKVSHMPITTSFDNNDVNINDWVWLCARNVRRDDVCILLNQKRLSEVLPFHVSQCFQNP